MDPEMRDRRKGWYLEDKMGEEKRKREKEGWIQGFNYRERIRRLVEKEEVCTWMLGVWECEGDGEGKGREMSRDRCLFL